MKRPKEEIAEDWCFVCKEGGHVLICDCRDCLKVYHPICVGKDDSFLDSDERWICGWHVCITCNNPSKFRCYCCPMSWCVLCFSAAEFVLIKGNKGFCGHCLRLVALVEQKKDVNSDGEKVDFTIRETVEFLFMDYWAIINAKEGLTSETIQSAYANYKKGINSIVDAEHDDSYESEDETMVSDFEDINDGRGGKRKVKRQRHSIKKQVHKVPQNLDGGLNVQQTCFVSMVKQNMGLVYLRRGLVEELSKHPQAFKGKVVGSFVRVESDPPENLQRRYRLLQVTGISNDVYSGSIGATLLQVSYGTKDIPISMLSDDDFTEEECAELCRNVKECLHKNITRAEFEEKVRNLHVDITNHSIVRELAVLQSRINQASEEGWRRKCFEYTERIQLLLNPTEQSRLLHEVPAVIEHPAETKPTPEDGKRYSEERRKSVSPKINLKGTSETPMKSSESNGTHCVGVKMETEDLTSNMVKKIQSDACTPKKRIRMMKQKTVIKNIDTSKASTSKQKVIKDKPLAYRSSLSVILNLVNCFKFSQMEITSLKKLPFWFTLKPFIEGNIKKREQVSKKNSVIKKLLETYSVVDGGFIVGGKIIKLTKEEIENVFGIVGGEVVIDLPYRLSRPSTDLADLIPLSGDGQLRYSMLQEALKLLKNKNRGKETEQFADNVAKIVCLMLLSNLFLPSSNPTLKWGWLRIVDDLNEIKKFDWSGQILKSLTRSLEEVKGDYALCKGFVPSVLYIFAEHATEALQLRQENENAFPRFMGWNSSYLCEKFREINFAELEIGKKFCAELLKKTTEEEEGYLPTHNVVDESSKANVVDSSSELVKKVKDSELKTMKKKIHVLERKNKTLKEKISKMKKEHKLERGGYIRRIEELEGVTMFNGDGRFYGREPNGDVNVEVEVENARNDVEEKVEAQEHEHDGMEHDGEVCAEVEKAQNDVNENVEVNAGMKPDGELNAEHDDKEKC